MVEDIIGHNFAEVADQAYSSVILALLENALFLIGVASVTGSTLLATSSFPKSTAIECLGPWQFFLHFSAVQSLYCPLQVTSQVSGSLLLILSPLSVLADCLCLPWGTGRPAVKTYLNETRNCTSHCSIQNFPLSVNRLPSITAVLGCLVLVMGLRIL